MKKGISAGLASLCALGIAGDFLIKPSLSSNDGSDIVGILFAAMMSLALYLFLYPLLSHPFRKNEDEIKGAKRWIYATAYLVLSALLIGIAVFSLYDLTLFTVSVVLSGVPKAVSLVAFALTALIIASKRISSLSKTAVVLFFVTVLSVVVIFLFSLSHMSLKYVLPLNSINLKAVIKTALSVLIGGFLQGLILALGISGEVSGVKSVAAGNIAGGGLILLSSLNTLLVFGGGFASTLSYPYTAAVRTVGAGDIFSGMDGFLYIAVFFCSIIKISLALYGVKSLSVKIYRIKKFSQI